MEKSRQSPQTFLVVGAVRNCARTLAGDVQRINDALSPMGRVLWYLVESDSQDDSVAMLERLSNDIADFRFRSLGSLRDDLPLRTERLAYCRNVYLDELRSNALYGNVDFVVAADFDGINVLLTPHSVQSCWTRDNWDVCAANQAGPYYDVMALRHADWCPNDAWRQEAFLRRHGVSSYKSVNSAVYARMLVIEPGSDWIEVDSAFGGFVIYKRSVIDVGRYHGLTQAGEELCEHVLFHAELKAAGARIYINPAMINAAYTEHTRFLTRLGRIKMFIRSLGKDLLMILGGERLYDAVRNIKNR